MKTYKKRRNHKKTKKSKKGGNKTLSIKKGNNVQEKIQEINRKLQSKCDNLKLVLNYREDLTGEITTFNKTSADYAKKDIILCLYKGDNCISSITFELSKNRDCEKCVNISSRTSDDEEGKKYNTFLRMCAIILIGIWGFPYIESYAENAITVWLFSKYFYDHLTFDSEFIRFLDEDVGKEEEDEEEEDVKKQHRKTKLHDVSIQKKIKTYLEKQALFVYIKLEINEKVVEIAENTIDYLLHHSSPNKKIKRVGINCE